MVTFNYPPHADELVHHGIKGQRWGVRRFQNADGTRTEAGKKRYSVSTEEHEYEEDFYGTKIHTKNTAHKVKSESGTEASKSKVDKLAKEEDYDSAMEFDSKASKVIDEYVRNGKDKALDLLDSEFGDYSYSFIIDDDYYAEFGESYVTYTLSVMGNSSVYSVSGDKNGSDEAVFIKLKK